MSYQMDTLERPPCAPVAYNHAVNELLTAYSGNSWFTEEYWPLNSERVGMIIDDVQKRCRKGSAVFEVGCGTGYIAYLLGRLGYRVSATDAWSTPESAELLQRGGVTFAVSNLNELDPFPNWHAEFDAIVLGEVIEHILNSPLQLLKRLGSLLRSGGTMVVTTPNACTAANALRMLLNTYSLWGTQEFCREPKIMDGRIISIGEIHYREYRPSELQALISDAGLVPESLRFIPCGIYNSQPLVKRAMKRMLRPLLYTRLLGAGQYVVARKPSSI